MCLSPNLFHSPKKARSPASTAGYPRHQNARPYPSHVTYLRHTPPTWRHETSSQPTPAPRWLNFNSRLRSYLYSTTYIPSSSTQHILHHSRPHHFPPLSVVPSPLFLSTSIPARARAQRSTSPTIQYPSRLILTKCPLSINLQQ